MNFNIKSEAAAGVVAGAAFIASAGHIVTVVAETNHIAFALVYPIGIDGLLFVGIRALQAGRRVAGILALVVGSFFSLAFNGDAENALVMPKLLIAASMPVCMLVAFVIEATGRIETAPEPAPQIITKTVAPALLPIVPFVKPQAQTHEVVPVASRHGGTNFVRVEKPAAPKTDAPAGRGRVAAWDVEKAVRLLAEGRTDADVLATVDGLTAKPWQRTKRAVKIMQADASTTDESIAETVGQSAAHIARIRAAMKESN